MTTLRKIFVGAALTCGASLLTKQVAIVATGGADTESAIVGVLWGLGILSLLVAAGTGTALLLKTTPLWVRLPAGVVAGLLAFPAQDLVDAAVKSVYESDSWFRDEVALVLIAVVMAALGLRELAGVRSRVDGQAEAAARTRS